jgi:predicted oxidoreductase
MIDQTIILNDKLELSRLVHGHWRLADWKLSAQELLTLTHEAIELGITTFDHADIYGDYSCEALFGETLRLQQGIRQDMQLITKCGIKLTSDKFPERQIKTYDYSYEYIIASVEQSLKNFQTDYIDVLLLHRPAPYFNPEEVALAFAHLKSEGKVLHFGVSNFSPMQFQLLNAYTDDPLVTNQIEISPYCLEHFDNGNIDFLLKERIKPMAWSPLAGGSLLSPGDEKGKRLLRTIQEVGEELHVDSAAVVAYSWLLNHPAGIMPIIGSGNIDRLKSATTALDIQMTQEQWYEIYISSTGNELP